MKNATKYLVVGSLGVLMTRRDISSLAVKGLNGMKTPTLFSPIIAHLTIFSSIPEDSLTLVIEKNCFKNGVHTFVVLYPMSAYIL